MNYEIRIEYTDIADPVIIQAFPLTEVPAEYEQREPYGWIVLDEEGNRVDRFDTLIGAQTVVEQLARPRRARGPM